MLKSPDKNPLYLKVALGMSLRQRVHKNKPSKSKISSVFLQFFFSKTPVLLPRWQPCGIRPLGVTVLSKIPIAPTDRHPHMHSEMVSHRGIHCLGMFGLAFGCSNTSSKDDNKYQLNKKVLELIKLYCNQCSWPEPQSLQSVFFLFHAKI